MKTRNLIATSIIAISAAAPTFALANPATQQGDGTSHIVNTTSQRDVTTRQAVVAEYKQAVNAGTLDPVAGDATQLNPNMVTASTKTRAEVVSKLRGRDTADRLPSDAS